MKGLRASQEAQSRDPMGGPKSLLSALDKVFSSPKTEASAVPKDVGKAVDLNIGQSSSLCLLAPPILPPIF